MNAALAWQDAGNAVPFAIVRAADNTVIGSARFWNLERWSWARNSRQLGPRVFDACDIGYPWLASSTIRPAANTEAKVLMLTQTFEAWQALRRGWGCPQPFETGGELMSDRQRDEFEGGES